MLSLLLSQIRCADICSELTLLEQGTCINKVGIGIIISTTPNNCTIQPLEIPVNDKQNVVEYVVSLSPSCCK